MRKFLLVSIGQMASCAVMAQIDTLPIINQRVLSYVNGHVGERVGRGECWDLAAEALNSAGARWDGSYVFGRVVDPEQEPVLPGDIVQFEGVEFRWTEGLDIHVERMPHHTAVIVRVERPGVFIIAQQNTQGTGRKTGLGDLVLARRTKGMFTFFRPIA